MHYDAVVIGAGISGITVALMLAKYGQRVALVEKHHQIAPIVRGFTRKHHHFDTGFHYAGRCPNNDPLGALLRYFSIAGKLQIEPYHADCFDHVKIQNTPFTFDFPLGIPAIVQRLGERFPHETEGIRHYLAQIQRVCEQFSLVDYSIPLNQRPSLQEILKEHFSDPLLIKLLSAHSLLYGTEPDETSFLFHAMVVGPYYQEAYTFKGGGKALVDLLQEKLEQLQVDQYLGSEVSTIEIDSSRRVTAVTLANQTTLRTSCAVYCGHPKALLQMVPPSTFRPAYGERVANLEETPSAYALYGVTRTPLECLHASNVIVLPEERAEVTASNSTITSGVMYVTKGRAADTTAPNGFSFFTLFPASKIEESGSKAEITERMKLRMAQTFPQFEQNLVWAESASPKTFARYSYASPGSLYGAKHCIGQTNPHPLTRVPGLLLAGQSVGAPGLIGAMASAVHTAALIIGQKTVYSELSSCL